MQLRLLPVYSRLAEAAHIPAELAPLLAAGYRLSAHQVETYTAMRDPQVQLVFNTALTGDGKTLAGMLRQLVDPHWRTLAMYPTNELIRDQRRSIEQVVQQIDPQQQRFYPNDIRHIDGRMIDEIEALWQATNPHIQRGEVLKAQLQHAEIALTNPDIFHLIMQFKYWRPGKAHDWLIGALISTINQLTFDEFHLFEMPQVGAILTALIFLKQITKYDFKTLFLSATPDRDVYDKLLAAGFADGAIRTIDGTYTYDDAADTEKDAWRQILQPVQLTLAHSDIRTWLETQLEDTVIPFFKAQRHHVRGAIILNSVARAQGIYYQLREQLAPLGIDVRLNTGLSRSTDWHTADLVVATSTVDVGVDFAINFLLFEASDASRFLQRLGRVGRHKRFRDREGTEREFADYVAIALLPTFVYARLVEHNPHSPALLNAADTIDRERLRDAVLKAFPSRNTFHHYLQDWGKFMPATVLHNINHPEIRATYKPVYEPTRQRYSTVFGTNVGAAVKHYQAGRNDRTQQMLIAEACSFRGQSSFDCAVLFDQGVEHDVPVKSYDLFWLLANAQLSLCTQAEFMTLLNARSINPQPYQQATRYIAYVRMHGLLSAYREVRINLQRAQYDALKQSQAQCIKRLQIECPGFDEQNELNQTLRDKTFVATIVDYDTKELRMKLFLPGFFRLYPCDFGQRSGSIAFDREALLLDSVLRRRALVSAPSAPLMI